jgi:hypothetical protein
MQSIHTAGLSEDEIVQRSVAARICALMRACRARRNGIGAVSQISILGYRSGAPVRLARHDRIWREPSEPTSWLRRRDRVASWACHQAVVARLDIVTRANVTCARDGVADRVHGRLQLRRGMRKTALFHAILGAQHVAEPTLPRTHRTCNKQEQTEGKKKITSAMHPHPSSPLVAPSPTAAPVFSP